MSRTSYQKFKDNKPLTRKQAMDAQCFECNGYSNALEDDCKGLHCPLYQWSKWGKNLFLRPKRHGNSGFQKKKKGSE